MIRKALVPMIIGAVALGGLFAVDRMLTGIKSVAVTHLLYSARNRMDVGHALRQMQNPDLADLEISLSNALARDLITVKVLRVPPQELSGGALEDFCQIVRAPADQLLSRQSDELFSGLATEYLNEVRGQVLDLVEKRQNAYGLGGTGCSLTAG